MLNPKSYREINEELNNYYSNKTRNIWRNNFHIEMPFGLINDPNGLSYYDNKFHIFYQWNPFGCEHKTKHWGLVTTSDFINFTKPQIILKPEDWFDKNGCYSGCGLVKDDELKLYYTGNVKGYNDERESYQCVAVYHKDGTVEKHGVIIEKQPDGYTAHFRDPYIFMEDSIYYMILGVQNNDLKGKALIYKSKDSVSWALLGELKTNMHNFGYMWECPNVIKLNEDKHALIFSPQGLNCEEFRNQNIYQSGYVIGELSLKDIQLKNHTEFKELDMGFDFYAPQVFNHKNKNIMFGWVGLPDKDFEYPTSDFGWMYSLTMPRVLEYKDNVLYQKPLEEIKNLRQAQVLDVNGLIFDNYNLDLGSRCAEIVLNIEMYKANFIEMKFKFNEEYILLTYDKINQVCTIDRSNMNLGGRGVRRFKLKVLEELKLNMFIDNSIMEIYYQDGLEVTTLMYFPNEEQLQIQIRSDDKIKVNELSMWNLRSVRYE
ncbi:MULTISPECIES: sucrose-6-phosphate hydrolase [unclassified Clostridium]|uniref:glycoside hydrolase family 32 protein n=1 Tax=unclassified Clostridium TaxID=2614128 RepID=UPI00029859AA|nr:MULTISPECIES: sucrose-6-phosphate hydrolase [unclassified Clostridium]EKQ57819.1 MAG: sucrose-6-phosphate hydrolase [Clostridium sp. Maddingley MBC34-26]